MEKKETQTILFENQFQVTEDFMKKYGKELGKTGKRWKVFQYSIFVFCFGTLISDFLFLLNSYGKGSIYWFSFFLCLLTLILQGAVSSKLNISRSLKKRLKEEKLNNYNNVLERHYTFRQESLEFSNGIRFDYSQIRKIRVSKNFIVLMFRYPLGLGAIIKKDAFSIGTSNSLLDFISNRKIRNNINSIN